MQNVHSYLRHLALYSEWSMARIYDVCAQLAIDAYQGVGRQGSIHALLNRLLAQDRLWLSRLRGYDVTITAIGDELHDNFDELREALTAEDVAFVNYVRHLSENALDRPISYSTLHGKHHTSTTTEMVTELLFNQAALRGAIYDRLEALGKGMPGHSYLDFVRDSQP